MGFYCSHWSDIMFKLDRVDRDRVRISKALEKNKISPKTSNGQ